METIERRSPARRPRRTNSLSDIGRMMYGTAAIAHEPRDKRFKAHAAKLFDTDTNSHNNYFKIQTANLFLRQFGVKLVANDRVLHIWEEWPGAIGAAWLDDGPAGDVLRHLKSLALDTGAPVPRPAQSARLGVSRWTGTFGGPTSEDLRLATDSKEKLNERTTALRDADQKTVAQCEAYERRQIELEELFPGITRTAWEAMTEQWFRRHCLTRTPAPKARLLPSAKMAADFLALRASRNLPEVRGVRLAEEYLVWRDMGAKPIPIEFEM